jgi:hypothetical protein
MQVSELFEAAGIIEPIKLTDEREVKRRILVADCGAVWVTAEIFR